MVKEANIKIKNTIDYFKGAGLSLIATQDEIIDWSHAAAIAFVVGDVNRWPIIGSQGEISVEFESYVRELEPKISEFTNMKVEDPLCCPVIFDRAEWIVTAIESIKPLVDPLLEHVVNALYKQRGGSLKLTQAAATTQMGTVIGYLSKRVLGQYDLPIVDDISPIGKLYFIYPNIEAIEKRLGLESRDFRRWLALHESTHGFEFESNKWLQSHLRSLIDRHTDFIATKINASRGSADNRLNPVSFFFSGSLKEIVNVRNNKILSEIQAFMSLIEGYSDYVMKRLSRKLIPKSELINELFERRRRSESWAERLIEKYIGLDIKLKQYEIGESFVANVVDKGGMDLLNHVWSGPESLPSLKEIEEPALWIRRVS